MTSRLIKSLLAIVWCYNIGIRCGDLNERNYVYVSQPMSLNEAEAYCVSTYNQHLATIITKNDMSNAVSTLTSLNGTWIGLRSVHKSGWFEYFGDVECPADTKQYGACLGKDFWVERKPIGCCPECVTLHTPSDGYGQINNDIECESKQQFLCNAPVRKYINSGLTGNWDEAYNHCLNIGGLASFETERDLKMLQQVIGETSSEYAWIGLVQRADEQNWYWMDGTKCGFTDDLCTDQWSEGEPNGKPGHVSCECKSYGCIRNGCKRVGCKRQGCKRTGCINKECHKECEHMKHSNDERTNRRDRPSSCLRWKDVCTCLHYGCVDYGCVDYGCVDYGCMENGCTDYQCVTQDADCAAVQSHSGLAADYHCTTNIGAIICNDHSTISAAKVVPYLFEPEHDQHVSKINDFWGLLNKYNNGLFVLLAMSCMVNICLCVYCGWCKHKVPKVKYESVHVDVDEELANNGF